MERELPKAQLIGFKWSWRHFYIGRFRLANARRWQIGWLTITTRAPWLEHSAHTIYPELKKRPVAWRVKDFADGWIIYQDEQAAYTDAEHNGALIQGLYVRDGT